MNEMFLKTNFILNVLRKIFIFYIFKNQLQVAAVSEALSEALETNRKININLQKQKMNEKFPLDFNDIEHKTMCHFPHNEI